MESPRTNEHTTQSSKYHKVPVLPSRNYSNPKWQNEEKIPMTHILRTTDKLLGLNIDTPDNHQRAILALFANDTTVFLSKNDSPKTLFEILDKWCSALGAKFNKDKTVVIPVGSENYRKEVNTHRSLNSQNPFTFPDSIHILKDRETTQCLGAQVGNNPTGNEPWPRIIDDIEKSLSQWNKAYPSIDGC